MKRYVCLYTSKRRRGYVEDVSYSSDGSRIVSCNSRSLYGSTIDVWTSDLEHIRGFDDHEYSVYNIAFVPGYNDRFAARSVEVKIMDMKTNTWTGFGFGSIDHMTIPPDGATFATCTTNNSEINIWNLESGACVKTLSVNRPMKTGYSPDGSMIASGSRSGEVRVWDTTTWECLAEFIGEQTDFIQSITFSPDNTQLTSGSSDRTIIMRPAPYAHERIQTSYNTIHQHICTDLTKLVMHYIFKFLLLLDNRIDDVVVLADIVVVKLESVLCEVVRQVVVGVLVTSEVRIDVDSISNLFDDSSVTNGVIDEITSVRKLLVRFQKRRNSKRLSSEW